MNDKTLFYEYDLDGLQEFFSSLGEKPFRAKQLMTRIYKNRVAGFSKVTEFSNELRKKLDETLSLQLPEIVDRQESSDGTVKLLVRFADGESVETVLIPDEERLTQCVSTQAGCAMGCTFCRTATLGLSRNLTAGEIVAQLLVAEAEGGFNRRVSNVVFMGMGEPLHNFDATVKAFNILSCGIGLAITRRRITVSTCGLADKLKLLPPEMLPSLAISLNATTDEVRDRIMPVNKRYPIKVLIDTLKQLALPPRARFTIEYVLIGGVNDSLQDARRLVQLLSGLRCKVNLIPLNENASEEMSAPTPEAVSAFQGYLLDRNFVAVKRKSRGEDIMAACGQLRATDC